MLVCFSGVVTFTAAGPTLTMKDVRVIPVYQDKQCFYRCIAACGSIELQEAKRLPLGYPEDCDLWTVEDDLADYIKTEVVSLLRSQCDNEELQQLCSQLSITLSRPVVRVAELLEHRIDDIERNNGNTDILEILAISYLAKTQLHVYDRNATGYRLKAKYPPHVYSSRQPIMLVYKPDDQQLGVPELFELLLMKNTIDSRQWTVADGYSLFTDYAQMATDEERKITFEQLICAGQIPQDDVVEKVTAPGMCRFCYAVLLLIV
jgi:hypothetical protein